MYKQLAVALSVSVAVLCGASCGKKSSANAEDADVEPKVAFDSTEVTAQARKPVDGADTGALSEAQKNRFEKLADTLSSPCGKAHSLRTSRNTDPGCLRAPFAVQYVVRLLKEDVSNKDIREHYERRYRDIDKRQRHTFQLAGVPAAGSPNAGVELVEFFDYRCPACRNFRGELDKLKEALGGKAIVYYKMFPLAGHQPGSGMAAQAALAVHALDKKGAGWFLQMHDWLFENQDEHTREGLARKAESLGIPAADFEKAYKEAEARVEADRVEGQNSKQVSSTPTLFLNGYLYEGPMSAEIIKMHADEAMAVAK